MGEKKKVGRPKIDERNSRWERVDTRLSLLESQVLEDICDFEKKNKSEVMRAALRQYARKYYKLDNKY